MAEIRLSPKNPRDVAPAELQSLKEELDRDLEDLNAQVSLATPEADLRVAISPSEVFEAVVLGAMGSGLFEALKAGISEWLKRRATKKADARERVFVIQNEDGRRICEISITAIGKLRIRERVE